MVLELLIRQEVTFKTNANFLLLPFTLSISAFPTVPAAYPWKQQSMKVTGVINHTAPNAPFSVFTYLLVIQ